MGTPIALALDLGIKGNNSIFSGSAYICTNRDQTGSCHGLRLDFIPQ
jgi:hypothetical protein